jgi:hypothetical protein
MTPSDSISGCWSTRRTRYTLDTPRGSRGPASRILFALTPVAAVHPYNHIGIDPDGSEYGNSRHRRQQFPQHFRMSATSVLRRRRRADAQIAR